MRDEKKRQETISMRANQIADKKLTRAITQTTQRDCTAQGDDSVLSVFNGQINIAETIAW